MVLLAGEFLKESKVRNPLCGAHVKAYAECRVATQQFVEDGLHSAHIIKGYRTACRLVSELTIYHLLSVPAYIVPEAQRLQALQHLGDLSISIHSQSAR